jgi:hypothetical protein
MPVERIDAHQCDDLAFACQIVGDRGARAFLVRERDRILKVEDDRIGARRGGLGEAFGAVAGDEEQGAEAHQASFFLISAERSHWQTISSRWLMQRCRKVTIPAFGRDLESFKPITSLVARSVSPRNTGFGMTSLS